MVYILDTHTLLWFLEESSKIGPEALKILRDSKKQLIIPSIVLAEIKYLSQKGRTGLLIEEVIEILDNDPRCVIYPLDSNVIQVMPVVWDIHDGIILGTALVYKKLLQEETKVLTKDEKIQDSQSVETLW